MEEIKGELKENLSEKDIEKRKSKLYKFIIEFCGGRIYRTRLFKILKI